VARKRLSDRYRRQVRDESRLRFGGQKREIRAAARQVDDTYRGDVRTAKQGARGAKRAARSALPVASKALGEALARVDAGPTPGVSAALGNLGPAATRDANGTRRRLAETLAATQTELAQRIVDAEAGKTSAIRQARSVRAAELKSLSGKMLGVASDAGAFRSGRLGELVDDARDRRVTKRGQDKTLQGSRERTRAQDQRHEESLEETSRHNREMEKNAAKNGKGKGRATPTQVGRAESQIALAKTQAARLKSSGRSREEIAQLLITGRESSTIDDPDTGEKLKVPAVKKVDQRWASVALDLVFDGEVSQKNRRIMRGRGYRPKRMGYPVAKSKRQVRRDGNKAANRSPGSDRAQS
jgi:hypothetical protein